jgi:hypothetical protein
MRSDNGISVIMGRKPGSNSGKTGAIYREVGPRGGMKDNFTTVPEDTTLPPTSKPGNTWVPIKRTPHGHRKDE